MIISTEQLNPAVEQTTTFWTFSNDECSGAIAISDGEQISSDTTNATDSGDNISNDLWYSYTGNGQHRRCYNFFMRLFI